jgi:hypothetical protein
MGLRLFARASIHHQSQHELHGGAAGELDGVLDRSTPVRQHEEELVLHVHRPLTGSWWSSGSFGGDVHVRRALQPPDHGEPRGLPQAGHHWSVLVS